MEQLSHCVISQVTKVRLVRPWYRDIGYHCKGRQDSRVDRDPLRSAKIVRYKDPYMSSYP